MHEGQVAVDAALVAQLVAEQFPRWASLPARPVANAGTVNAVYRLGDALSVRLPLVEGWASHLEREVRWLPYLRPRLGVDVPQPIAVGAAAGRYPFPWAVYDWIDGEPYADGLVDERQAAHDLAAVITELRGAPPIGAPSAGRAPLRELDDSTRESITDAASDIDAPATLADWERALSAFDGVPVWIHGDLLRPNLLVRDGRLRAVIDWGGTGVGDPAADVIAAWTVFGADARRRFRGALEVDDATWERARGFALHQAVALIPYYRRSNPGMTMAGLRTVGQILSDA